jgi:hypothetical protein
VVECSRWCNATDPLFSPPPTPPSLPPGVTTGLPPGSLTCQLCDETASCFAPLTTGVGPAPHGVTGCPVWSEAACPGGLFYLPPGTNASLGGVARTETNVATRVINDTQHVVYAARDVSFVGGGGVVDVIVLGLTLPPGTFNVGDVVASAQADIVFDKVLNVTTLGPFTVLLTTRAALADAFAYLDVNMTAPVTFVADESLVERVPTLDSIAQTVAFFEVTNATNATLVQVCPLSLSLSTTRLSHFCGCCFGLHRFRTQCRCSSAPWTFTLCD